MMHHRDRWEPGRLWSLLDMLEVLARPFLNAVGQFEGLAAALAFGKIIGIQQNDLQMAIADAKGLEETLKQLDLPVSAAGALRLHDCLLTFNSGDAVAVVSISNNQKEALKSRIGELKLRLQDELGARKLLSISPADAELFEQAEPLFGYEVRTRFSQAKYDIEEAGKCLALERSTASVYHQMRVMEIGALAVLRCLGGPEPVTPQERNLGNKLGKIKERMGVLWPNKKDRLKGDGLLFDELFASLDARKDAWRNNTNHPGRNYTQREARDMLAATRELMIKTAGRCDEDGQPHASP